MGAKLGRFDTKAFDAFVDEFENKAKGQQIVKAVENNMVEVAGRVINQTKRNTPVDTGNLRGSWQAGETRYFGNTFVVTLSSDVEYSQFIEEGHRVVRGGKTVGYYEGRHMLKNAIDSTTKTWDTSLRKVLARELANILGG